MLGPSIIYVESLKPIHNNNNLVSYGQRLQQN